jgi:hypothetical protein
VLLDAAIGAETFVPASFLLLFGERSAEFGIGGGVHGTTVGPGDCNSGCSLGGRFCFPEPITGRLRGGTRTRTTTILVLLEGAQVVIKAYDQVDVGVKGRG